MSSPSMKVFARRRYHKLRQKSRRKRDLSTRSVKDTSEQAKHTSDQLSLEPSCKTTSKKAPFKLPHITHKRLTNKNGFYFKGAVVTSPQRRETNGHLPDKPKRSSTDYDLLCLLKASKDRRASAPSHSASLSTVSEFCDDICDDIPKESPKREKSTSRFSKSHSKKYLYEFDSPGSSENNASRLSQMIACGKINQDYLGDKPIVDQISSVNLYDEMHQVDHNDISAKDRSLESNTLSGNSDLPRKKKGLSFSAYHKFVVGITNALLAEKRKHFPNSCLLETIEKDLNNIFNNSHGKMSVKPLQDESSTAGAIKESKQVIGGGNNSLINITRDKNHPVPNCETEKKLNCIGTQMSRHVVFGGQCNEQHTLEERNFKERKVEVWVKAVQEMAGNKRKRNQNNNFTLKCDAVKTKTEKEFLKNVEYHEQFQSSHPISKGQARFFNDMVKCPIYSNRNQASEMDTVTAPFSSKMPPNNISLSTIDPKVTSGETVHVFDPTSCFVSFDNAERPSDFLKKEKLMGNGTMDSTYTGVWNASVRPHSPMYFNHSNNTSILSEKPRQSWLSWFLKPGENSPTEKKLESSECVSPSPCFLFDSPPTKSIMEREVMVKPTMKNPRWDLFPKHLEKNLKQIHPTKPVYDLFYSKGTNNNKMFVNLPFKELSPHFKW